MSTEQAVITARGLRRHHGKGRHSFEAVRGIDLTIHRGELFALLGTNGAGKTSTLEVLEGLAPASGGTVEVFGRDPYRQRREIVNRMGIMLQQAGFPDDITVTEMARMWHGTLAHPKAVAAVLADVHLSERAGVRVKSLSGGERRRLDLGLALMGRPQLLFLDEPTTGLDPQSRQVTWELIRSLLDEGTTVVLTTHYLAEAEELATRLAIMDAGAIHTEGTVADIVQAYNSRISFDDPHCPDLELELLPGLAAPVRREGVQLHLETSDLQQTLAALLLRADRANVRLNRLDARSSTLEQAFLTIANSHRQSAQTTPNQEIAA